MEAIFFEKQQGNLCAQHCLNALLQGDYFSAIELAGIARELDRMEKANLTESAVSSSDTAQRGEDGGGGGGSHHYDDSGYFSVQVIERALQVYNLSLEVAGSSAAPTVLQNPCAESAFICHYNNHWFAIRKLGRQWFNLNSMQRGPKFISDTYLSLFLAQLKSEGYYIFVVRGQLPDCEAHQLLTLIPHDPSTDEEQHQANTTTQSKGQSHKTAAGHDWGKPAGTVHKTITTGTTEYQSAYSCSSSSSPTKIADPNAVRNKRLKYFEAPTDTTTVNDRINDSNVSTGAAVPYEQDMSQFLASQEDPELAEAIRLSLLQK